jgi:RNA polymerase sigma-B factor
MLEAGTLQSRWRPAAPRHDRLAREAEERWLFTRYRHGNDPAARAALVERFLPLARHQARRYHRGGDVALEDLVQVASLGLLNAIDRFDPGRDIAFSSYAVPTIAGELKRYFRDKVWSLRVPRALNERALRVDRTTQLLINRLGRPPTASDIAEHLDITIEDVLEAREAATAYRADSLDRPTSADDGDGASLVELLGADDPGFNRAEQSATLERLMRTLTERQREILHLRFAEDLTQAEIGERVGLSQMQISRLLRQAIHRLRETAETTRHPSRPRTPWAAKPVARAKPSAGLPLR